MNVAMSRATEAREQHEYRRDHQRGPGSSGHDAERPGGESFRHPPGRVQMGDRGDDPGRGHVQTPRSRAQHASHSVPGDVSGALLPELWSSMVFLWWIMPSGHSRDAESSFNATTLPVGSCTTIPRKSRFVELNRAYSACTRSASQDVSGMISPPGGASVLMLCFSTATPAAHPGGTSPSSAPVEARHPRTSWSEFCAGQCR